MSVMPNTKQEVVPEFTYIAKKPNQNNFLTRAKSFHKKWGLKTLSISSLEEIVNHLADSRKPRSRIRIVTHASGSEIILPFFKGGIPELGISRELLEAFAISDVKGLSLLLGKRVNLNKFVGGINPPITLLQKILADIRANGSDVLEPFGLHNSDVMKEVVSEFFQRVAERIVFEASSDDLDGIRTLRRAVKFILGDKDDGLRVRVRKEAGVTAADVDKLEAAIKGSKPPLEPLNLSDINQDDITHLKMALRAIQRPGKKSFRHKLKLARNRFKPSSVIDIRGCQAGKDQKYLKAVAALFVSKDGPPVVTGPVFFVSFPTPESETFKSSEAGNIVAEPEVVEHLKHWAKLTGAGGNLTDPAKKLVGYTDAFILPVPMIDDLTAFHTDTVNLYWLAGPVRNESAIEDWLDSQWIDLKGKLNAKKKSMRRIWKKENQAPPCMALAKNELNTRDTDQVIFIEPDPRYMELIKSSK